MAVYTRLGQSEGDDTQEDATTSSFSAEDDAAGATTSPTTHPLQSLSPMSTTTTPATMTSPSPSTYLSLAEQTFTPVSMNSSEFGLSESVEDYKDKDKIGVADEKVEEQTGYLLGPPMRAEDSLRVIEAQSGSGLEPTANLGLTGAEAFPPLVRSASIVSTRVQSYEALQATAAVGHDLVATKTNSSSRTLGLVSPPSTLSPSPSPSPVAQETRTSTNLDTNSNSSSSTGPNPGQHRVGQAQAPALGTAPAAENSGVAAQENAYENYSSGHNADQERNLALETAADTNPNFSSTTIARQSAPSTAVADTTIVRPTPEPRRPRPLTADPSLPPIVRTLSSASIGLNHPTPDINKRSQSGAFLGNIAALEATAERLSRTNSIEDAIRDEHNELKRSDSRRSSLLRARAGSDATASIHQSPSTVASRHNSILGTNSAARLGGYSPGGYVMSPQHSVSAASTRLRSGSKGSSLGVPPPIAEPADDSELAAVEAGNGEDFPFMARNGPGKASTRSTASKLSLAQIAELEPPSALTQAVLDEADRVPQDPQEDENIRASARQHIDPRFAEELSGLDTPDAQASQPMIGDTFAGMDLPTPRLQLHQPGAYAPYGSAYSQQGTRPKTSGSTTEDAFGDFDGVHCDPNVNDFSQDFRASQHMPHSPQPEFTPMPQQSHAAYPPRPQSYFDPGTGQQMLYYPAPVPAMLNLPPKLSKKPKAAVRNMRRSQVLSAMPGAMPQAPRDSRFWLPDPTEGLHGSLDAPLMTGLSNDNFGFAASPTPQLAPPLPVAEGTGLSSEGTPIQSQHARQPSETSTIHPPPQQKEQEREFRKPQRLTANNINNRKSRATMLDGLPPQLRASAFFDLPSVDTKIELKDGSATATLDSILDAGASAPVSAFTDHAFAGKLGSEVYGPEKKKSKKAKPVEETVEEEVPEKRKRKTLVKRNSSSDLLNLQAADQKKRASHLSLFGGKRNKGEESDDEGRKDDSPAVGQQEFPSRGTSPNGNKKSDEESEESEAEQEQEEVYQGPPTTLLAELQLRKQRNKLRTRPAATAYPNGLHSTLLELDAVAEQERKARRTKKVNLAWEDPAANPANDSDDEDVPLGMLLVAKNTGAPAANPALVMSEVHRPLGLMERRELEDNEPLSRRKARLQGKDNLQMPMSLGVMQARMSQMNLGNLGGLNALGTRSQSRLNLPLPPSRGGSAPGSVKGGAGDDSEPEAEGETLAQRKARLAAENPLPRARPVSGMFSSELLSQFGGDPESDRPGSKDSKGKGKAAADDGAVPEEEETLGQRSRRLRAEREAREREMGAGGIARSSTPGGLSAANGGHSRNVSGNTFLRPGTGLEPDPAGATQRLSRQLSMSDVLNAHPLDTPMGMMNPREQEQRRREAELARAQTEKEVKMAMLRAQMPAALPSLSVGASNGGFAGGRFNDGLAGSQIGGGLGFAGGRVSPRLQQQTQMQPSPMGMGAHPYGAGYAGGAANSLYGVNNMQQHRSVPNLGVYGGVNPGMGLAPAIGMGPAGMYGGYNNNNPYGGAQMASLQQMQQMQMQGHAPAGGPDMVERWRQSIMP